MCRDKTPSGGVDWENDVPLSPLRSVFRDLALDVADIESDGKQLVGLAIQMDLPELGLTGEAFVVDIEPAQSVKPGQGQVVTATFHHSSGDVIDLVIANETGVTESFGTTSNHPFWSADRDEYVQAGSLREGENLLTFGGDKRRVVSQLPRPGPVDVYNLEVYGEHVYFVGEDGVLVHNMCHTPPKIYREGGKNPGSLTPRPPKTGRPGDPGHPGDPKGLSTKLKKPKIEHQVVDTSKLKELEAVVDGADHASIRPKDMSKMQEWIDSKSIEGFTHRFTKELKDAIIKSVK